MAHLSVICTRMEESQVDLANIIPEENVYYLPTCHTSCAMLLQGHVLYVFQMTVLETHRISKFDPLVATLAHLEGIHQICFVFVVPKYNLAHFAPILPDNWPLDQWTMLPLSTDPNTIPRFTGIVQRNV